MVFNTRHKIEEQMLIAMDKSTQDKNLFQLLQTNRKLFENALSFLTIYSGIFFVAKNLIMNSFSYLYLKVLKTK